MRKNSDIFSYFGVIFIGFDNGMKNIWFVGLDCEDVVENGMSFYFLIVIWFVCKRYVEEDCKRKFCVLGILVEYCIVFL